jgi:methylated-DNA-protein-cysteine methyltransferase related protein
MSPPRVSRSSKLGRPTRARSSGSKKPLTTPAKSKASLESKIRATIMKIPRGQVSSYGAVARAAGFPGAARQVVRVLRHSYGLPWQRVVGAGGRIALPGEKGLEQRFRLETEGVKFSGKKVRMKEFEFKFGRKGK